MELYLGMSQSEVDIDGADRGTDEGGKLKEIDNYHWISPNTGADNSSGFTALPGGYGRSTGGFEREGTQAWFWQSSEKSSSVGWCRALSSNNSQIGRGGTVKDLGMSVRCVKDSP